MKKTIPMLLSALLLFTACESGGSSSSSSRPPIVWNKYTVEFYDGETLFDCLEVNRGEFVTAEDWKTPKKEGYYFLGWYNGETLHDFEVPVTSDICLQAKWEEITMSASGYAEDFSDETVLTSVTGQAELGEEAASEDGSVLKAHITAQAGVSYTLGEAFRPEAVTFLQLRYKITEGSENDTWQFTIGGKPIGLKANDTLMGGTNKCAPMTRYGHIVLKVADLVSVMGNGAEITSVGFLSTGNTTVCLDSVRVGTTYEQFNTKIPGTEDEYLLADFSDKNAAANVTIYTRAWWSEHYKNLSFGWNGKECYFFGSNWGNAYMFYQFPEPVAGASIADKELTFFYSGIGGEQNHLYFYLIDTDGYVYYCNNQSTVGDNLDDMKRTTICSSTRVSQTAEDGRTLQNATIAGIAMTSRAAPNEYGVKSIRIKGGISEQ